MQICYNCGKEVDDNVLICPECGALVQALHQARAADSGARERSTPLRRLSRRV